jgi:hypothetical protein
MSKGYLPVVSWDPSTPIPDSFAHEVKLESLRATDYPFSVDVMCKTPTWLTTAGGSDHDPIYGYTALYQFRSINELGLAIDYSWHGRVHNTIGGDMGTFHSPIDPIFWRWHRWIDEIRAKWWAEKLSHFEIRRNAGSILEKIARFLLIGSTSDHFAMATEKTDIDPHIPPLLHDSISTIDALMGVVINEISYQISDSESSESLQKTAIKLLNNAVQRIALESSNTKAVEIQRAKIRKKKRVQL